LEGKRIDEVYNDDGVTTADKEGEKVDKSVA